MVIEGYFPSKFVQVQKSIILVFQFGAWVSLGALIA